MDFLKSVMNKSGESFIIPFGSALDNNDFHISLHDKSYGMHFKINCPYRIQSEPLKYNELIKIINNAQTTMLKQTIRLPRKSHPYHWIIPEFDKSVVSLKENQNKMILKMKGPLLNGFKTITKGETYFIPRDFFNLRDLLKPNLVMGYVPDTNEIFYFIPLSADQINSLAHIIEKFDYNLYSRMGGVFMTIDLTNGKSFLRENMPRLFEILYAFFQEVNEKGINLFDSIGLYNLFNFDIGFT